MMWRYCRKRVPLPFFSATLRTHLSSEVVKQTQCQFHSLEALHCFSLNPPNKTVSKPLQSPFFTTSAASFTSSVHENPVAPTVKTDDGSDGNDNDGISEEDDGDDENMGNPLGSNHYLGISQDVKSILDILLEPGISKTQLKNNLENCSVSASPGLVSEVLSRVRNDWETSFTFFLWAGKQPNYAHSLREYHSMISILAKMRKFDTAWALIKEMRENKTDGKSLVTPHTLLIMIRRYCAIHEVGKAINTFYAHKLFNFDVGMKEFHDFLSALCRYKNVKDAEHLLFCNETVFPLNTKSFNIILNGWCNIVSNPREAKRVWREMGEKGVARDVVSYSSIISCFSKVSNVHEVLKLFDEMKNVGVAPDRKVYNAVVHALAKGRRVKDACNLLKAMEENGIAPNAVTYNSLIKPLCTARLIDEAQVVFDEMLRRGLSPTVRTYHAFLLVAKSGEECFSLLEKMTKMGCHPQNDTYSMLIRKFCRWRRLDDVFKLWEEMSRSVGPDRSSYVALVYGLFLNGKLEEAYKYYEEMKEKKYLPEPKLDEMLQTWLSGKQIAN